MAKSADAFRTISEVADWLETPAHVLRFWESRFTQIKPVKRAGGRRYYRPADMLLLGGIKKLLHDDGITIKAAQKVLREEGVKHVQSLSIPVAIQVTVKKKTDAAQDTPKATEPTPPPVVEEQMDFLDMAEPAQEPATTPRSAPKAPLFVAKLPKTLKSRQDIPATDLQDIEAMYFSLKMVRNNMQRTTVSA